MRYDETKWNQSYPKTLLHHICLIYTVVISPWTFKSHPIFSLTTYAFIYIHTILNIDGSTENWAWFFDYFRAKCILPVYTTHHIPNAPYACIEYVPTFTINLGHSCREIYQSHSAHMGIPFHSFFLFEVLSVTFEATKGTFASAGADGRWGA